MGGTARVPAVTAFAGAIAMLVLGHLTGPSATAAAISFDPARRAACTGPLATNPLASASAIRPAPASRLTRSKAFQGFVENTGQVDPAVAFYAGRAGARTWITSSDVVFDMRSGTRRAVVRERFAGAALPLHPRGEHLAEGTVRHLSATDRRAAESRTYGAVRLTAVWPGIAVRIAAGKSSVEQDYLLGPGADPGRIRIDLTSARPLRIAHDGSLLIPAHGGTLREDAPRAFQSVDGERRPVPVRYRLLGKRSYGFTVGAYDRTRSLTIDPEIAYSRFIGGRDEARTGTGIDLDLRFAFPIEGVTDMVVDPAGNTYLAGKTNANDFPVVGTPSATPPGRSHGFVTKLDPDGNIVFSTYLGGPGFDRIDGIARDGAGNLYVGGTTSSRTGLGTPGSAQPESRDSGTGHPTAFQRLSGPTEGFVSKLSPDGRQLIYSTYLGGIEDDSIKEIAVDATGSAYVVGFTRSGDFPLVRAMQPTPRSPAAAGNVLSSYEAFVTRVSPTGSAFTMSTYLGGSSADSATGVAVANNQIHVTGSTESANFPLRNAQQRTLAGGADAFLVRLAGDTGALTFGTFHGGAGNDSAAAVAVDRSGRAWMAGRTGSTNFPELRPIPLASGTATGRRTSVNGYVTTISAAGRRVFSSRLGGAQDDAMEAIAMDAGGDAYLAGYSESSTVPRVDSLQAANRGVRDGFVVKIDGATFKPVLSTLFGSRDIDWPEAVAAGRDGAIHFAGTTFSPNLPGQRGPGRSGGYDAFAAKLVPGGESAGEGVAGPPLPYFNIVGPHRHLVGRPVTLTVEVGNYGETDALMLPVWLDGIPRDAQVETDVSVVAPPGLQGDARDAAEATDPFIKEGDEQAIGLIFPRVRAGDRHSFRVTVTAPPSRGTDNFRVRGWADPPIYFGPRARHLANALEGCIGAIAADVATGLLTDAVLDSVPAVKCVYEIGKGAVDILEPSQTRFNSIIEYEQSQSVLSTAKTVAAATSTAATCIQGVAQVLVPQATVVIMAVKIAGHLGSAAGAAGTAIDCYQGAERGAYGDDGWLSNFLNSLDPNDKSGLQGHGPGRFIGGSEPLSYLIQFENKSTATAPAHDVVITDRLDPRAFDFSSVRFGRVSFGKQAAGPISAEASFSTDVDLRPARDGILRIEGSFDRATGIVRWTFRTLDPATKLPSSDVDAGFLPPNKTSPEGEGSVLLSVRARRGLAHGARISNSASIVFDSNAPIVTPAFTNRVDRRAPSTRIVSVRRRGRNLAVRWTGTDRGAGLASYDVLVSDNGGPFKPFQVATRRRSASFRPRAGHRYVFTTAGFDRLSIEEPATAAGDLAAPGLRAARRGTTARLRAAVRVDRAGTYSVVVRSGRRAVALQRGSRAGAARARSRRGSLTFVARRPGRVRLDLRMSSRALGRRSATVRLAPRRPAGSSLTIPFR